jgi:CHASE2 domain-containing sensor protein
VKRLVEAWGALPALAVALAMLAAFFAVGDRELPLRIESELLDLRFRLRPTQPGPVSLVIVEIDDASITEIGRWPWSRRVFAQFLDRIVTAKPKLICLDLSLIRQLGGCADWPNRRIRPVWERI